ncbi:MAG: hypothetical protein ACRC1H_07960 [Caldilineaceae bacterium]
MILLISMGNSLRRDDGAGHPLADALEIPLRTGTRRSVKRLQVQQLAPELSVALANPDVEAVVFCDAAVPAADASGLRMRRLRLGDSSCASLTHDLSPEVLLAYTTTLLPTGAPLPPAWMVTIAAHNLDHGEGLSDATQAALVALSPVAAELASQIEVALTPATRTQAA